MSNVYLAVCFAPAFNRCRCNWHWLKIYGKFQELDVLTFIVFGSNYNAYMTLFTVTYRISFTYRRLRNNTKQIKVRYVYKSIYYLMNNILLRISLKTMWLLFMENSFLKSIQRTIMQTHYCTSRIMTVISSIIVII